MAKKDKRRSGADEEIKSGGSVLSIIIVLFIIILWIAIFAILVKLDFGGLGSMLRPTLKDIPIINAILPDVPEELEAWEKDYEFTNFDEAMRYIVELEAERDALKELMESYPKRIEELEFERARLLEFEKNELDFKERVRRYEDLVVYGTERLSPEEYMYFYGGISQTTAEEIHEIVARKLFYDEGVKIQANILKAVKPAQAAAILEESTADIEWIVKIFKAMKETESTAIVNKMDSLYAAKIFRKMQDMSDEEMENFMNEVETYIEQSE